MAGQREPATLRDQVAIFTRRRRLLGSVAGVGFALTMLVAFLWPATFRSTGTILIEQQEIPSEFIRAAVSSYADQRVQMISQRVMTTVNLLGIIQTFNLYSDERQRWTREEIIDEMRDDIHLEMISADVVDPRLGRATKATIAFSVSYDSRSPDLAARVANELSSLYLRENLETRRQLAADAASFLSTEADRLAQDVAALETALATFKQGNVTQLPDLVQVNMQLLSRTEEELRNVETSLRSRREQFVYLDAQLAQLSPVSQILTETGERVLSAADRLKVLRSELASARALYSADHPDVQRLVREVAGLERQVGGAVGGRNDLSRELEQARSELAEAQQRYSAEHPDVRRWTSRVVALETALASQPVGAAPLPAEVPDNPSYVQIKAQREAAQSEINSLQEAQEQLRNRIASLERRLEQTPEIERQYDALTRELDGARLKFNEVRQKQLEAELAENLETERKGERFTLIEPPLPPETPFSPNRLLILWLGLLLSGGVSLAATMIREATDETVRGRQDLFALLDVPPLAVIPRIRTHADRARAARVLRIAITGGVAGVILVLVLTHFLFRPLDVLWYVALRRLGI